ncbi:MAG: lytic murein transglycosylase [Acidocella sp.]|nr:lytic murein transglycosylase [Acidocella sp.]
MDRRIFLATGIAASLLPMAARARDFASYLAGLQARAAAAGIPRDVITQTTGALVPNADVLRLDKHQPEFTETWETYSSHVLNQARVAAGQAKAAEAANLLAAVTSRFGVASGVLMGIWGIETNYGKTQGDFGVIDALVTLAWDRQSSYFGGEAIAAMKIIAAGQAPADKLIGSYAGAMGQPQFMPSVYLSTAVAFSGDGRPDIWSSDADTLASMANYLAKDGWRPDEPSSESVLVPPGINLAMTGRQNQRTIGYWTSRGVQRLPGAPRLSNEMPAALLLPDGAGGQAFLVFPNFSVIRRYNPSDFYALAVGALGRMALS